MAHEKPSVKKRDPSQTLGTLLWISIVISASFTILGFFIPDSPTDIIGLIEYIRVLVMLPLAMIWVVAVARWVAYALGSDLQGRKEHVAKMTKERKGAPAPDYEVGAEEFTTTYVLSYMLMCVFYLVPSAFLIAEAMLWSHPHLHWFDPVLLMVSFWGQLILFKKFWSKEASSPWFEPARQLESKPLEFVFHTIAVVLGIFMLLGFVLGGGY